MFIVERLGLEIKDKTWKLRADLSKVYAKLLLSFPFVKNKNDMEKNVAVIYAVQCYGVL